MGRNKHVTTQQRLDCLLKQLNAMIAGMDRRQGARIMPNVTDMGRLTKECGFLDEEELVFFFEELVERGLMKMKGAANNPIPVEVGITIEGYRHLDQLAYGETIAEPRPPL